MQNRKIKLGDISAIYKADNATKLDIPLYESPTSAGFGSPADDYIENRLDLNEFIVKHPSATFFVRVSGDSMINAGIETGDILVVDRAIEPTSNKIVLAIVEGEFVVKRYVIKGERLFLVPENDSYQEIELKEGMDFEIWGVVVRILKEPK